MTKDSGLGQELVYRSLERAVNELDATRFGEGKITVELYTQPGDHSQEFANRRKMCPTDSPCADQRSFLHLSHMALLRAERVKRRSNLHPGAVIANDQESTPHNDCSEEESRSAWSNTDLDRNTGVHRNMDVDRNKLEEDHNKGRDKLDRQAVAQRRSLSPPLSRLRRLPRRMEGEAG